MLLRTRRCFLPQSLNQISFSSSSTLTRSDEWLRSIVKPKEFYDQQANDHRERCYFYNIDIQGRLFLEETLPKNIATSIKDTRFLNFFFLRIRPCNEKDYDLMDRRGIPSADYPFVSPCGSREFNFIRPSVRPIVFHELRQTNGSSSLLFGGDLQQTFDEKNLAVSTATGRLYHRVLHPTLESLGYGLIKSSVGLTLSDRIEVDEKGGFCIRLSDESLLQVDSFPHASDRLVYAV